MMHTDLDSVLNIMNKITEQLDRTVRIVQKQEQRIASLEDRVTRLEYPKEEK